MVKIGSKNASISKEALAGSKTSRTRELILHKADCKRWFAHTRVPHKHNLEGDTRFFPFRDSTALLRCATSPLRYTRHTLPEGRTRLRLLLAERLLFSLGASLRRIPGIVGAAGEDGAQTAKGVISSCLRATMVARSNAKHKPRRLSFNGKQSNHARTYGEGGNGSRDRWKVCSKELSQAPFEDRMDAEPIWLRWSLLLPERSRPCSCTVIVILLRRFLIIPQEKSALLGMQCSWHHFSW